MLSSQSQISSRRLWDMFRFLWQPGAFLHGHNKEITRGLIHQDLELGLGVRALAVVYKTSDVG